MSVPVNRNKKTIDLDLSKGVYYVKIFSETSVFYRHLLVY